MKKIIVLLFTLLLISGTQTVFAEENKTLKTSAKAVYVTDGNAKDELYSFDADKRYPIASMVKIMTALITCEAIERGNAKVDEQIVVTPTASGMGGSQMFLDSGLSYPLGDLLKGVIVVSANDACLAIAERLQGSEEGFVETMNARAKELGMQNTHFANCTGLPASGGYSSARDVAKMLSELSKHELYHTYSKVWLEDYVHPDGRTTTFTNTNKLIRFYDGCDGGKTGFTNEAGFCLAATAKKNGIRVISVVIGESDSKTRFADSTKLLNYAFGAYTSKTLLKAGEIIGEENLKGGKEPLVYGVKDDFTVTVKRGDNDEYEVKTVINDLELPVAAGDIVGKVYAVKGGEIVEERDLYAFNSVEKQTYGDSLEDVLGKWGVKTDR